MSKQQGKPSTEERGGSSVDGAHLGDDEEKEARPRLTQGGAATGAPQVTSIAPTSTNAGHSAITLRVDGSGFSAASVVVFNGSRLATASYTATQITAMVPSTLLQSPANVSVVVDNGGSMISAAQTFSIHGSGDINDDPGPPGDPCDGGATCSDLGLAPNQCVVINGSVVQCDPFDRCVYYGCE